MKRIPSCKRLSGSIILPSIFVVLSFFAASETQAQRSGIAGRIVDAGTQESLPGATVILTKTTDTLMIAGTSTSTRGMFFFADAKPGKYALRVSFIGYESTVVEAEYSGTFGRPLTISLKPKASALGEVTISESPVMMVQKGDTSEYNANAFKTHPDATAEDLIRKMPGVTTEGNTVKVHGEEIKKVLVDGKPFFGDDPAATLKNLPAEIIEKIQVFDKQSDQAEFTGFRDGDEQKALNIVTRGDRRSGQFGRVYAGYGTDERYNAGLVYNKFENARRFSVIGMVNNVNQQNFNISDIMGIMQGSGRTGGRMGRMGGGPGGGMFSAPQKGNTITQALGLNYSDQWGKRLTVSGSYFFNRTENTSESVSTRTYFTNNGMIYNETANAATLNSNHRANFRFEYAIDTMNSLIFNPSFTIQDNSLQSTATSENRMPDMASALSQTNVRNNDQSLALNFQSDLLYMRKFSKTGRTLSVGFNNRIRNQDGDGDYQSTSWYADTLQDAQALDQEYTSESRGIVLTGSMAYTEPLGKKGQLMLTYRPSWSQTDADRSTYDLMPAAGPELDTTLTNRYINTYTTHQAGMGYRYNTGNWRLFAGADLEAARLEGEQEFPAVVSLSKDFTHILPSATINYEAGKTRRLEIRYRTSTNAPSISQLQDVIDISNPLIAKTGNMNLKPSYENNLRTRLNLNNEERTKNFFIVLSLSRSTDYISNATYFLKKDTIVSGYLLNRGSQLVIPENLGNYTSIRSFMVYSRPVSKLKSTVNFNTGYNYIASPARIDNTFYHSHNHTINAGASFNSNISENFDFSTSYGVSYSLVANPYQESLNNNYLTHRASLRVNYIFKTRLVLNSDVNLTAYSGLSEEFAQNYYTWNAYMGYKLLKSKALEARVSVSDLLNQNKSLTRNITESYIEDARSNVLQRYFMFTLTYNLRSFGQSQDRQGRPGGEGLRNLPPPPQGGFAPMGGRPD